jgi:hypothetical protein
MSKKYVYRPTSGWIYLGIILVVEIVVTAQFFAANYISDAYLSLVNSVAFDVLFWTFVVKPKIVFTDRSIVISNPFTKADIGWLSVEEFQTRFAFTVTTSDGRSFKSWAATAPGRYAGRRMHETDYRGTGLTERKVISPSDSPRTDSGIALILALKWKSQAIQDQTATAEISSRRAWFSMLATGVSVSLLLLNFFHG